MIPEGATHKWEPNDGYYNPYAVRLHYYKIVDGNWWCYSSITGWRKSENDANWFATEIAEGFFKPIMEKKE